MTFLAEQMCTASFDAMPAPLKPEHETPVKNRRVLVTPSTDNPYAVAIIKFMTFSEAIGCKILKTTCHGECMQLDVPERGVRSKSTRVALHRFLLGVDSTHLTPFAIGDGDRDAGEAEGSKPKILTDEEVDAGFDLNHDVVF